jgi:hypothetical protein
MLGLGLLLGVVPGRLDGAEVTTHQSRYYEIHTTLDIETVRPIANHLDQIFALYERRFSRFEPRGEDAMPLYLFGQEREYRRFLKKNGIDAKGSGGLFFVTRQIQGLATWVLDRPRSTTLEVLQHEGFHQFAWNYIGPDLPRWVNEGLAQYFEDALIVDEELKTGLADGMRIARVRQALSQGREMPVQKLLTLSSEGWNDLMAHNAERSQLIYAQAWSMVYFLIHGDDGRYQQVFEQYLHRLADGQSPDAAVREAFGIDSLEPMSRRWREFAKRQQPDRLHQAQTRMKFIGQVLRHLSRSREGAPDSMDRLRRLVRSQPIRVTLSSPGLQREFVTTDEQNFYYTGRDGRRHEFKLVRPQQRGFPPSVTARQLSPQPVLVWQRDTNGKLLQDIEYH